MPRERHVTSGRGCDNVGTAWSHDTFAALGLARSARSVRCGPCKWKREVLFAARPSGDLRAFLDGAAGVSETVARPTRWH